MTVDPVALQNLLKNVAYPATKQRLMEEAAQRRADEQMMAALAALPEKEYRSTAEVSRDVIT
ncbi:DUF2795 domain-containing protein [Streptomyces litchfieldiae]|uniref:DUF2795 domain-containing protein n=1 Tax=Streptomyces litchfieldiae TaxID=3075543 RepID=A0ABU2MX06_9ACTN|nr:DUF2795 domain-containing protein [Streptomyces sp. DSM 44938]MDT0346181.1 DUF2795 domain-containing protein [Streptomyces sp. DSM 44938]